MSNTIDEFLAELPASDKISKSNALVIEYDEYGDILAVVPCESRPKAQDLATSVVPFNRYSGHRVEVWYRPELHA